MFRIEETSNGAVACQVLDYLFPRTVPMQKVNWGARSDYEFIQNYKILQKVFNSLEIDKKIEVNRLVRGRYQDNLEFMQWLRKFFEINAPQSMDSGNTYDAVQRRNKGKNVGSFKAAKGQSKSNVKSKGKLIPIQVRPKSVSPKPDISIKKTKVVAVANTKVEEELKLVKKENEMLKKESEEKQSKVDELVVELSGLEKERDYYFNKLREVEKFFQAEELSKLESYELSKRLLTILYTSEEDENNDFAETTAIQILDSHFKSTTVSDSVVPETKPIEVSLAMEKEESETPIEKLIEFEA